jgi:flagellar biosynthetic protein FliP
VSGAGTLGFIAALLVTFGTLALAIFMLRRLQATAQGRGVPLRVLQRIPVGPKQGVALVQVADRVLVVSISEHGTSLLTELSEPARAEALRPHEPDANARPAGFKLPVLGRLMAITALVLAAGAGRAHAASSAPAVPAPGVAAGPSAPATARSGAAAAALPPISTTASTPSPARAVAAAPLPAIPAATGLMVRGPTPPRVEIHLGEGKDKLELSGTVGLVVFLGVLTLLPAIFLLMTSFTRILIVLHFLRSALGTQTTPPGQLLVAFAVLLTGVVMNPVLQKTHQDALEPYFSGRITQTEAYGKALQPFREFMLANTRDKDLGLFTELTRSADVASVEQVPTLTVISAFVTSELRTAFQMGFVIFLPFVVLDVIVASVLMSLGMFMLPPPMVSLPFKLLLFVLADGWTLVVKNLVTSFHA